jgi:hypothetical protein
VTDDPIITLTDFRTVGICPKARTVFFEKHRLDWKVFVRDGIALSILRATGDHQSNVDRLEAAARRRLNG